MFTFLYQPFFNLLLLFYWLTGWVLAEPDMGVAVILLTLVIRLLLLPVTLASHRSEIERREIQAQIQAVKELYVHQPLERKAAVKRIMRGNPRILLAEVFMFSIQVVISLILWFLFSQGLNGSSNHLLYDWMPVINLPEHPHLLHIFTLDEPHWQLSLLQSIVIFVLETVGIIVSPYPVSRDEVIRVQLILPLMSFFVFLALPAGKKLFVITTLLFSLVVLLGRIIRRWWLQTFPPPPPEEVGPQLSSESISTPLDSVQ